MKIIHSKTNVRGEFFAPVAVALQQSKHTISCHNYTDLQHLESGIGRALAYTASGRAWVQHIQTKFRIFVSVSNFFAALRSKRRMNMVQEIANTVRWLADQTVARKSDPLLKHSELDAFAVYASDGHTHQVSAHEKKIGGKKRPVTHIYSLNLRFHTLAALALSTPQAYKKKEHEVSTLKRIESKELRMGEPKGIKVLHVYDPAIIDYRQWHKWKQGSGIYILTLEKCNSALTTIGINKVDRDDPRNIGVISDELVGPPNGVMMRRVTYRDPVTGKVYRFITNELTLPPGLIAFLYKLRWDVEKTFDEIKNKTFEKKAWAGNDNAKRQQSMFIALAHNLMRILEMKLEHEEGIVDCISTKKQKERIADDIIRATNAGRTPNPLVTEWPRATQRCFQFIRWLVGCLENLTSWCVAVDDLRPLMRKLL